MGKGQGCPEVGRVKGEKMFSGLDDGQGTQEEKDE